MLESGAKKVGPDRRISVIYGDGSEPGRSLEEMTRELLETVRLADRFPKEARIALKPNLVVASPASEGATTHPEIVEGVIQYLQSHGFRSIAIIEGSWIGDRTDRAFTRCGYRDISARTGVPLIDTQITTPVRVDAGGYPLSICDVMADVDVLINMPVLKGHCQTYFTGALKNLKGCIPDSEKRRFHSRGLHEPIARLNTVIHQDFIVMDAICGDPTFEEGGTPSRMHRILCCDDPVCIDSYGTWLLGLDVEEVAYILRAEELGVGTPWDESEGLLEVNSPPVKHGEIVRDPLITEIAARILPKEACSSCYAALIQAIRRYEELHGSAADDSLDDVRFAIGRGYRSVETGIVMHESEQLIGIGRCFHAAKDRMVAGCPPSADAILEYLTGFLANDRQAEPQKG